MSKQFISFVLWFAAGFGIWFIYEKYNRTMLNIQIDKEDLTRKNKELEIQLGAVMSQLDTLKQFATDHQFPDLGAISEELKKSVFKIIVWKKKEEDLHSILSDSIQDESDSPGLVAYAGTAFCIFKDNILMTNYHVIGPDAEFAMVLDHMNRQVAVTEIIMEDRNLDYALLRAPGLYGQPLDPSVEIIQDGKQVVTMGNPLEMDFTPSLGWITSLRLDGHVLQINNPITYGNSGGPVVDARGSLVGLVFGGFQNNAMLNFAVNIHSIIEDIKIKAGLEVAENSAIAAIVVDDVFNVNGNGQSSRPEAVMIPTSSDLDPTLLDPLVYENRTTLK